MTLMCFPLQKRDWTGGPLFGFLCGKSPPTGVNDNPAPWDCVKLDGLGLSGSNYSGR